MKERKLIINVDDRQSERSEECIEGKVPEEKAYLFLSKQIRETIVEHKKFLIEQNIQKLYGNPLGEFTFL